VDRIGQWRKKGRLQEYREGEVSRNSQYAMGRDESTVQCMLGWEYGQIICHAERGWV
jgi:hypothetical protein